jgi:hypothetical protein
MRAALLMRPVGQPRYRRFLAAFLLSLCALLGATVGFNFIVDPLHYYRGLTAINPVFLSSTLQRYLNVGLARNFPYDTVVIGSSLTENFLASHLDKSWGVRAINLSISGSTSYEQQLVLREALRTGKVRDVIWAVDFGFYGGATRVRDDQAPFPYQMYRHPAMLNIEYPMSFATLRDSIKILHGYGVGDLDTLYAWYPRFTFSRAAVLKAWGGDCSQFGQAYREDQPPAPTAFVIAMREAVRQNLAAVVEDYPDVIFHVFFPPATTLYYVPAASGNLHNALPLRRAVAEAVADRPNVLLSDFQADPRLIDALDHYMDMLHFDLWTTEYITDALRLGRYRIHPADIAGNNARLIRHVNEFTLCRDGELVGAPDRAASVNRSRSP